MAQKKPTTPVYVQPYRYASPNIPMSAIKRFARQIAEKFHPEKIVLFGSYAYGTPHSESDVDLLVIMPTPNAIAQSIRISLAFERQFSLDLIVRTPKQMEIGLQKGDCNWFLVEVMEKGKVLYAATHGSVGTKSRGRHSGSAKSSRTSETQTRRHLLPLPASRRKVS